MRRSPLLFIRRARATVPLLLDLVLVLALFVLDARDLYYKISYIGPLSSFSFYAISQRTLQTKSLALLPTATLPFGSGWPSLLSKCERLQTASPFFFIGAMGINCQVGAPPNNTVSIPQLYLSSSVRADSLAWVGCKLLHRYHRPRVCYDPMVVGFTARYGFEDVAMASSLLASPGSAAEAELLVLLDVIAKSEPIHKATCVEGFEYTGEGLYKTHIYGCGAPNVNESSLVGIHATAFKDLHQDKAWLTVDTMNLMGFKYILRQNVRSEFAAKVLSNGIQLTPKTVTNFSSSGPLYCLMIAVDVVLMWFNWGSALEIAWLMVIPVLRTHLFGTASESQALRGIVGDYRTVLTCPLYRSRPIVLLTVATQLLSWVIILPNSIIFTWSTSSQVAKIQAYLSSLRLWVLIFVLFNALWDWVVFFHERLAYAVSKRTYIASHEIVVVAAVVSYLRRKDVFAITGVKYAAERQRNTDKTSFVGTTAFGNSYDPQLDGLLNTPASTLWLVYRPLVAIILWSMVGIVGVLMLRLAAFQLWERCTHWRLHHRRSAAVAGVTATRVQPVTVPYSETDADTEQLFTRRITETRPTEVTAVSATVSIQAGNEAVSTCEAYERLPLEVLLNVPIRARSLVRSSLQMEATLPASGTVSHGGTRFVRAPYLLEHGVVPDRGRLRVRHGFFSPLHPLIELGPYVVPAMTQALQASYSLNNEDASKDK